MLAHVIAEALRPRTDVPRPTNQEIHRFTASINNHTLQRLQKTADVFGVSYSQLIGMVLNAMANMQGPSALPAFVAFHRLLHDHKLDLFEAVTLFEPYGFTFKSLTNLEDFAERMNQKTMLYIENHFNISRSVFLGKPQINHNSNSFYPSGLLNAVIDAVLEGTFDQVLVVYPMGFPMATARHVDFDVQKLYVSVLLRKKHVMATGTKYYTYQSWGSQAWNYEKVRFCLKELLLNLETLRKVQGPDLMSWQMPLTTPYSGLVVTAESHQAFMANTMSAAEMVNHHTHTAWYPEVHVSTSQDDIRAMEVDELYMLRPRSLEELQSIVHQKISMSKTP